MGLYNKIISLSVFIYNSSVLIAKIEQKVCRPYYHLKSRGLLVNKKTEE